jgi:Transposase DDE domain group 1
VAEPKTLRYRLLHVAARIIRHARRLVVRLQRSWPWAHQLAAAFTRLWALPLRC